MVDLWFLKDIFPFCTDTLRGENKFVQKPTAVYDE